MSIIPNADEQRKTLERRVTNFGEAFGLYKLLKRFGAEKSCGIPIEFVFNLVFSLVFTGRNLYNTKLSISKDTVYRFLNDTKIHWEKVLFFFSKTVISRIRGLTDPGRLCAIVVDDSPYSRNRSKKVELLTRLYDHANHIFFMGFRMLTVGFTDGNTFIPFASQLMASKKALSPATAMDRRSIAGRRRENAVLTMPERLYNLLQTAKSKMIPAKHVLFDSWFSNPITMMTIMKIGFFCIAMLKKNETKYLYNGEKKTLQQIHSSLKKRSGRSKYLASARVSLLHKDFDKPIDATIVFVREKSNKKNWCALISTDISLSEEQIIKLYGLRWDIEVFFKMCKSYLKLAKEFQGRSYDMMTAHTTIVFMRYICLAWDQRLHIDDRSLGELFHQISDELLSISFTDALHLIMSALLQSIHEACFLTPLQISSLIDSFLSKLPPLYNSLVQSVCES